jgi:hypothetical protein
VGIGGRESREGEDAHCSQGGREPVSRARDRDGEAESAEWCGLWVAAGRVGGRARPCEPRTWWRGVLRRVLERDLLGCGLLERRGVLRRVLEHDLLGRGLLKRRGLLEHLCGPRCRYGPKKFVGLSTCVGSEPRAVRHT